jgi:vancomycin resistance protein YoaR
MDKNLEILDFTTAYAVGQSRINLYFGDYPNPYVENSRVGLLESENVIVNPGDQFSFYDTIAPSFTDTWRTKNGRYIGSGICNSSTTLFRTALEAGMPILERYNHAWNVPKYDWPYEMNLVDAAYLTTPKADMRFQNDLDYPIKIKIEFSTDPEYEYQKVTFLTSPKAKKREVQLLNFKTWDYKSYGVFKGSFDRIVKQDGVVLRQDNFYSDYTLPYGT